MALNNSSRMMGKITVKTNALEWRRKPRTANRV
jgi:hypothetical protein